MTTNVTLASRFADRRSRDAASFRTLVALTYPVFLAAALIRLPLALTGLVRGDGRRLSVLARARTMAHTVIPFCFMG